jgi:hypothetical protein
LPVSQDLNIVLKIKELRHETSEYLGLVFEKPRGLTFEAGGWLDIRFFPITAMHFHSRQNEKHGSARIRH